MLAKVGAADRYLRTASPFSRRDFQRVCGRIKAVPALKSFQLALLPGVIAGVISIFTSWLLMGVIFYRHQQQTPDTWRPENKSSFAFSAVIHFLACIVIATLFLLVGRIYGGVFGGGIERACAFAVLIWLAMAVPLALDAAVYIKLHPLVVLGQLFDWLTTSILACVLAAWWRDT